MSVAERLSTAELQMKTAADKEDFESALRLRSHVRELRRLSALPEPSPNVFEIKTREPFQRPDTDTEASANPVPLIDETAIEVIKRALKLAEDGEIYGIVIISGVSDLEGGLIDADFVVSSSALDNPTIFIGAANMAGHYISAIEFEADEEYQDEEEGDE